MSLCRYVALVCVLALLAACEQDPLPAREDALAGLVKITPEADLAPPTSYSSEYEDPVPLPAPINTAGAEDSPFMLPDGNTLYFFFTPDVRIPVEKQVFDGLTGIYVAERVGGSWRPARRVLLSKRGKAGSDGCEFVLDDKMWFCSVREGYSGINWFTATRVDGTWTDWKLEEFEPSYKVGELHMYGDELYYHSDRPGGKGGLDIWVSKNVGGNWQEPRNVEAVNTADGDGWPAISPDGNELWITRQYGVWRSKRVNGAWQPAEKMFSPLAGEATIDNAGNVYFTHHFYKNNTMLEADIYVAYKK